MGAALVISKETRRDVICQNGQNKNEAVQQVSSKWMTCVLCLGGRMEKRKGSGEKRAAGRANVSTHVDPC